MSKEGQVEEFMRIIVKIKDNKSSFENLINKYTKAKAELYTIETVSYTHLDVYKRQQ